MTEPKQGEKYLHFKGGRYEVVDIARDCDSPEKMVVVYKQLYESDKPIGTLWVRGLDDFVGDKVFERETTIGGKTFKVGDRVKKFTLIEKL